MKKGNKQGSEKIDEGSLGEDASSEEMNAQEKPISEGLTQEDREEIPELQEEGPSDDEAQEDIPSRKGGRVGRFFRKLLIWLIVVVIAFGAGAGTTYFTLYQPAQEEIRQQSESLQEAQEEISRLEEEIERLSAFEERNQELQTEIEQTRLHITILSARSSVADALLALSEDNLAEAKLVLDKVGKTLDKLETMLNEDQVDVVKNMQQRHDLIMEELEEDAFSARSDLEVLSSKLGSLENTLFASP